MGQVIVVTSGKGGVGKTTTVANLGVALALAGYRTVLVDTDIGLRNLDVILGLENRIVYHLVDIIEGNCRLCQSYIKDKKLEQLYLIPAAQTRDKSDITEEQMKHLTARLREEFDYVLLDCPAGIEQGFKNAIVGADRSIVVTTPEVSAVRDADRVIGLLEANGLSNPEVLINRIRYDMVKRGDMMSVEDILDILAVPLLGVIPEAESIVISSNRGEPIAKEQTAPLAKMYYRIAQELTGTKIEIPSLKESFSLFRKVSHLLKRSRRVV